GHQPVADTIGSRDTREPATTLAAGRYSAPVRGPFLIAAPRWLSADRTIRALRCRAQRRWPARLVQRAARRSRSSLLKGRRWGWRSPRRRRAERLLRSESAGGEVRRFRRLR